MKVTKIKQHDITDCGAACLASISSSYGKKVLLSQVRELCGTDSQGTSLLGLQKAAEQLGFKATGVEGEYVTQIKDITLPAIAHIVTHHNLHHYVVVASITDFELSVMDPAVGDFKTFSYEEFNILWESKCMLLLEPSSSFYQKSKKLNVPSKKEWLKKLIKPELQFVYQGVFLGIIGAVLGILMSVYVKQLIDDFIPNKNIDQLYVSTGLLCTVLFFKAGFNYVRQNFLIQMAKRLNNRLMNDFYTVLISLKKSFFDTRKTGEFVSRMNDSTKIQTSVSSIVNTASIDVVMLFISLIYIFLVNTTVALISIVILPFYAFIVWKYLLPVKIGHRKIMEDYAKVESNYVDQITGIESIKVDNHEAYFQRKNQDHYESLQGAIYRLGRINIQVSTISEFSAGLLMVLILGVGAYFSIRYDELTTGNILAIFTVLGGLVPSVARISLINLSLQQAIVAFDRLYEFMALSPEESEKKQETKPFKSLIFNNVSFRYNGRKKTLSEINLELKKGEMIALVGESGSGKTTIRQLMLKFYESESGQILWNQKPYSQLSARSLRERIGLVSQDIKIFNGTLFENIVMNPENGTLEMVIEFSKSIGLHDIFSNFPNGYLTVIGEEGINLSGGQKQLVGLSRALLQKPELLILDEATSALDMETEAKIKRVLTKLKNETSIVTITHRLSTVKHANRIYAMKDGKILESGSHHELLEQYGYYHKLYSYQKNEHPEYISG